MFLSQITTSLPLYDGSDLGNNFSQIMLRIETQACTELQTASPTCTFFTSAMSCAVGNLRSTVHDDVHWHWFPGVSQEAWMFVGSPNGLPKHCSAVCSTPIPTMHCRRTGFGRGVATDTLSKPHNHTNIVIAFIYDTYKGIFICWSVQKGQHHDHENFPNCI